MTFSTDPRCSPRDFDFIRGMKISGEGKCWPAFEDAVGTLPRCTCVEMGHGTELVPSPPLRSPPDDVFDKPRATRMTINDGAMPCELRLISKAKQATISCFPFILSQMTVTYVDLHRNHANDTLGGMPDAGWRRGQRRRTAR